MSLLWHFGAKWDNYVIVGEIKASKILKRIRKRRRRRRRRNKEEGGEGGAGGEGLEGPWPSPPPPPPPSLLLFFLLFIFPISSPLVGAKLPNYVLLELNGLIISF